MTRDDGYTRYTVRIPTPLYERVKAAAGEKSVNAEIVSALEKAYPAPAWTDDAARTVLSDFILLLGGLLEQGKVRRDGDDVVVRWPAGRQDEFQALVTRATEAAAHLGSPPLKKSQNSS